MSKLQSLINWLNRFQQKHAALAFPYGVIKKYGDDQAGRQAALLTYYGFLSIFPLLLVLTTVVNYVAGNNLRFQAQVVATVTNYFPLLGTQLSSHVHGLHKTGIALIVGIIFTIYGARGVADVFRGGVNHVWEIPLAKRDGFPKSLFKSLEIIILGGLGVIIATILSGLAGGFGHGLTVRMFSLVVTAIILFCLVYFLIGISLPRRLPFKDIWLGALSAAVGLVILQSLGTYLLKRELKNLDALYSYFAVALGLLFWLYLQSQVFYYAMEVSIVHGRQLWPRSLIGSQPNEVDKRVLAARAASEQAIAQQTVRSSFKK